MAQPSLFPQFMKGGAGGAPTIVSRAVLSELEVEVAPEYDVDLNPPVEAELADAAYEAEVAEPIEVEID